MTATPHDGSGTGDPGEAVVGDEVGVLAVLEHRAQRAGDGIDVEVGEPEQRQRVDPSILLKNQ